MKIEKLVFCVFANKMSGEKEEFVVVKDDFEQQNQEIQKLRGGKIVEITNLYLLNLREELNKKVAAFTKKLENHIVLKRDLLEYDLWDLPMEILQSKLEKMRKNV